MRLKRIKKSINEEALNIASTSAFEGLTKLTKKGKKKGKAKKIMKKKGKKKEKEDYTAL